ncbi:hypothetical protein J22TS3_25580 [Paenibacillus sp. J22TS3]|nr:hypothetical protein J22TS3_25580 [Paenibacillus sp. J22TS3]
MIPIVNYMPNVRKIKQNGVKIAAAPGKMTLDKKKYYGPMLVGTKRQQAF